MNDSYLSAAIEIAQEAGKILTQADKRSERLIVERLTKYFPDHAITAEEGTGHESVSASDFRWHVDPLDGTTNFAHGYPCFSVSIAQPQGQCQSSILRRLHSALSRCAARWLRRTRSCRRRCGPF